MSKRSISYIFRRPVNNSLKDLKKNKVPRDIFYGLTEIRKSYTVKTTDQAFSSKLLLSLQVLLNLLVTQFVDIGFSLLPTLYILKSLEQSDILFATVDTYGLPLALLKYIGAVKKPLIFNTIGLYDGLIRKNSRLALKFYGKILPTVDLFVSGGSFVECQRLAKLLILPLSQFAFIPFGIDTKFFYPKKIQEKNEILIIGADPSRDWRLYQKLANLFPQEKFRIITYTSLIKVSMPQNVIFEYNLSYVALRQRIWEAKFLLILSKLNYHFAGQSTSMRAMSCGKAVIFTKSPGVEEYKFKNYLHCIMVSVNNLEEVQSAINYLNHVPQRRIQMGKKARQIIMQFYRIEIYAQKLKTLFDRMTV